MKIACIGGGPAGLYLGILVKRSAPEHEVIVLERNRPDDTFGFGVVFSDATLGNLAAADPETHAEIASRFARWDDIEIQFGGEVLRSTGHGFCGIERKVLLHILQARARALGVQLEFEHTATSLGAVRAAYAPDVIVACDGAASSVRGELADALGPAVDVRPNRFVWLGCTVPYDAFTFVFKPTPYGLFRVHAYRYRERGSAALPDGSAVLSTSPAPRGAAALPDGSAVLSTFIVECRDDTWRRAGLVDADEDRTVAILEAIFERELAGHRLIKNRSIWRSFPTVRCDRWHTGNAVLMGDAAHTAHFSIGSGTKLAMEDAIVLRDELIAAHRDRVDVPAALAAYEARRRPEVEALQAAAQASLEWFEGTERYAQMAPVQFTYSLMTRSLRVSHASVEKRDPHLARGVEQLLAAAAGIAGEPPRPTALPFALGDRSAASRIAVRAPQPVTEPVTDPVQSSPSSQSPIAQRAAIAVVDLAELSPSQVARVHRAGACVVARIAPGERRAAVADAVQRAVDADCDAILLDPADDPAAIEALPSAISAARAAWRPGGWIAAALRDRPATRAAVIGHAAQLVRAGADLLWVVPPSDPRLTHGARLPAAPLADRLRNELSVATAIECGDAQLADLDAAIAAGRADLVVVDKLPAHAGQP